ncbi:UdgX family uracil-DNA binding protein [Nocardioides sp. Arc9.136]|uniref:UdgX family uracil-DNA binding protein n=1 Tax=Nocardioides sp. Arc9.136 TaxID=2996826 RepID=UPI002665F7B0|nr:UdgX family uracil-DNA binding protein [Nocardioides sp. Arc9.136]WKN47788.1 UdgX family uracil-DNA binding protein [Nocardioides sp. Arc9.136]
MARDETERPGAERWVPERPTTSSVLEAVQDCRGCELWADATQAVMGAGPEGARLLVLGEQPGDREDVEGEPFVGPAGRLLDRALADAGIEPGGVYRTNVVKHFRWSGMRGGRRIHQSPKSAHVAACAPWLRAELSVVRPAGAVLLGGTAGKAVYGSRFKVGESRGRLVDWPSSLGTADAPGWVLTTTHPSAVLRADDRDAAYGELVADLRVAAEALGAGS